MMDLLIHNSINAQDFCDEFHRTYEFKIEDEDLSNEEKIYFMNVSQKAARFTEIKEDLIQYPNVYISIYDLVDTVIEAQIQLSK